MRRLISPAMLLVALVLSACGNAVANPLPPSTPVSTVDPVGAIQSATTLYFSAEGLGKISQAQVNVEKVEGAAARVRVEPADPGAADPAWVFLKNDAGTWTVVAGPGTAFTPDDMKAAGIPESLAALP